MRARSTVQSVPAEKRVGRETKEGLIVSYIHPGSRLGVLLEVNCETDFVAKTADFQEFTKNTAMQIAAANPRVVERDQLSAEEIEQMGDGHTRMADRKRAL